jgi:radical SAM protein with 4Fe4S-binding SPASM domain
MNNGMDSELTSLREKRQRDPADIRIKVDLSRLLRAQHRPPATVSVVSEVPFSITNIELTNRCPMRCTICPRTTDMSRPLGDMSWDTYVRIIDQLAASNPDNAPSFLLYLHHFGESLLHPELARFGAYANRQGLLTSLSINPLLLKGDIPAQLMAAEIGIIQIALDGHNDESFEAIRGIPRAYDISCRRLQAFLQQVARDGCNSRIVMNLIAVPGLDSHIAERSAFWRAVSGINAVYVKPFVTWSGSVQHITGRMNTPAPLACSPVTCREPFESLSIAWDGDVLACCFDHDKSIVLGNVRETNLAELWNGNVIRGVRSEFLSGRVDNQLCRDCHYLRAPIGASNVLVDAA